MNYRSCLVVFVLLLLKTIISDPLLSQEITDPEAEYARIKSEAFGGDYVTAAADARKLVNSFPSYGDARILLGRILAWQKDYKNAEAVIDTLLMTEPGNADALSAKSDILLWSKDNTPVSTGLRAGYAFDSYREPHNWFRQIFKAGAEHRFKFGPAAGGINIGNNIIGNPNPSSATELQFEGEAYPKLSAKNYAYLNYAYSPGNKNSKFFPGHRAAVELWQILPAGWSVSAGLNYYYFTRSYYIATVSVEKYFGKYWASLKGYLYFKDKGPTTSVYFNLRRYLKDNNYFQVTLGAGTAPDEPFDVQTDLMRLNAYSLRLAYNVSLAPKLVMRIGTGYSYEEYNQAIWRNRIEGNINFVYSLKMK